MDWRRRSAAGPVFVRRTITPGTLLLLSSQSYRNWFDIFARIVGSWLLAIGLLYGGTMLVPKRRPLPAPPAKIIPTFNPLFPDGDLSPDRSHPDVLPGIGGVAAEPEIR